MPLLLRPIVNQFSRQRFVRSMASACVSMATAAQSFFLTHLAGYWAAPWGLAWLKTQRPLQCGPTRLARLDCLAVEHNVLQRLLLLFTSRAPHFALPLHLAHHTAVLRVPERALNSRELPRLLSLNFSLLSFFVCTVGPKCPGSASELLSLLSASVLTHSNQPLIFYTSYTT